MMHRMQRYALPVLLFCALCCFPQSSARCAEPTVLSVSGQGSAEAAPDRAAVTIGVKTRAADAQEAQGENAARAARIQQALRDLGIAEKDIQTRNYNFHPTYRSIAGRETEIDGYEAVNSIVVHLEDIRLVGKAIDTALHQGANQVSSLVFDVRDTRRLRKEALRAAVLDARDKADIIAASLGKRIIGIKSVSESTGGIHARRYELAAKANGGFDTPIEDGTVSLSATVQIDYMLED